MPKHSSPDLTIVILNYNTATWLRKCLVSLQQYVVNPSRFLIQVIVVDNNSQDSSHEMLQQEFTWVTSIFNAENTGYAAGNNVALKTVTSRYVMLLNSDTECLVVSKLDELIEYADLHPKVSVITPKLMLASGGLDWASHRGEPTPWAGLCYTLGLEKLFPHWSLVNRYHLRSADLTQIHPIDACSGAAMIVRTAVMKRVGLLDEAFFMYAEDVDWCMRFKKAGGEVIFFPSVTIIHHKYKSGRGQKKTDRALARKTNAYFYDTMLQYYDKHYRQIYPFWVRWCIQLVITLRKGVL